MRPNPTQAAREGDPWGDHEDHDLLDAWTSNRFTVQDLAQRHQRVANAIVTRLRTKRCADGAMRYLEYLRAHPEVHSTTSFLEDPMTRRRIYDEVKALLQLINVETPGKYSTALTLGARIDVNATTAGSAASRLVAQKLAEETKLTENGRRSCFAYRWIVPQVTMVPLSPESLGKLLAVWDEDEVQPGSPQASLPLLSEVSDMGLRVLIQGRVVWLTMDEAADVYWRLERHKHSFQKST